MDLVRGNASNFCGIPVGSIWAYPYWQLVAGVGMCLSMKVIGNGSTAMFVLGVIVGIIGLLGMGVNYPIYKKLLAQGKQKYAFEIMELAKEISEK